MRIAYLALFTLFGASATATAQDAQKPCMTNFTVEGSFVTGKTFKTWHEYSGVPYDVAFRKTAQAVAVAGWGTAVSNKDTGTITATQAVTGSRRRPSAPLNVIVQEKDKATIRVDVNFSLAGGQTTSEDAARSEFCKLVEAGAQ